MVVKQDRKFFVEIQQKFGACAKKSIQSIPGLFFKSVLLRKNWPGNKASVHEANVILMLSRPCYLYHSL